MIGIGVDTTGSTPMPVDAQCRPLAMDPKWKDNLAAHAWLWKDHTGAAEAAAITATAPQHAPQYLAPIGGTYSSEWLWSKVWRCLKVAPEVFDAAASWVELADFVPAVLAGIDDPKQILRGVCPAGHKAHVLGGLGRAAGEGVPRAPRPEARGAARPHVRQGLPGGPPRRHALRRVGAAGSACPRASRSRWAASTRTTAPSAPASRSGTLVKIIGTSTCDCAVAPTSEKIADVPGICGIVNGSIMPGYYGIEAGQSAVGDILRWWVDEVCQGDDALHVELIEAGGEDRARSSRACSRSTGTTATARSSSTRA